MPRTPASESGRNGLVKSSVLPLPMRSSTCQLTLSESCRADSYEKSCRTIWVVMSVPPRKGARVHLTRGADRAARSRVVRVGACLRDKALDQGCSAKDPLCRTSRQARLQTRETRLGQG